MAMARTMLRHFEHQAERLAGLGVGVGGFDRVQDRGQGTIELHVDDGTDHLAEAALGSGLAHGVSLSFKS